MTFFSAGLNNRWPVLHLKEVLKFYSFLHDLLTSDIVQLAKFTQIPNLTVHSNSRWLPSHMVPISVRLVAT